jgi:pimeloyl-ACP methyl ester carboxylesterase
MAQIAAPGSWHFEERGQGPPLLLLHGLGASSFSWRDNIGPLSQYFRVVAPAPAPGPTSSPPGDWPRPQGRSPGPGAQNYH